ncbi:uncharacterized protein MYCFIDRAFT_173822 [Pseudocercospora fijiensis CIRAD86]|uniref:Uncharacterized protein n=1 Tax=Pseudocercospora fijiensis (strain CIRAD86) TaxID=383855 RepID=M3AK26_PSEFD|nr:uncharacterized protein MYCFIDRAFT_173822 [Pseudocercospora fijiensis CIRAD86]EME84931.1 hypothetical protein MYCFIDRAFT_173822 [Pseudocercospora fijiensis CIRAD86]
MRTHQPLMTSMRTTAFVQTQVGTRHQKCESQPGIGSLVGTCGRMGQAVPMIKTPRQGERIHSGRISLAGLTVCYLQARLLFINPPHSVRTIAVRCTDARLKLFLGLLLPSSLYRSGDDCFFLGPQAQQELPFENDIMLDTFKAVIWTAGDEDIHDARKLGSGPGNDAHPKRYKIAASLQAATVHQWLTSIPDSAAHQARKSHCHLCARRSFHEMCAQDMFRMGEPKLHHAQDTARRHALGYFPEPQLAARAPVDYRITESAAPYKIARATKHEAKDC